MDKLDDVVGYYKAYPKRTKAWVDQHIAPYPAMKPDLTPADDKRVWDDDLIPDAGPSGSNPVVQSSQDFLSRFSILDANTKWGKPGPVKKDRNGEWIRCPNPAHEDKDPSGHITMDERGGAYYCFPCAEGGDKFTFYAYRNGYHPSDLKNPPTFRKIATEMAESWGWQAPIDPNPDESPGQSEPPDMGTEQVFPPNNPSAEDFEVPKEVAPEVPGATLEDDTDEGSPATAGGAQSDDAPLAPVVPMRGGTDDSIEKLIPIPWRDVLPGHDTFLYDYMSRTTVLDVPDEFLFWGGMTMLSMACGRDVVWNENPNIYANLFVAILAPTGSGKSRAMNLMREVLFNALPYDPADPRSPGALMGGTPASGEAIVATYAREMDDPLSPGTIVPAKIRALWTIEELAGFVAKASTPSSTLSHTMIELYDNPPAMLHRKISGDKMAIEPFGCAFTSSQPEAMREFLTRKEIINGLLNRWVLAQATPKRPHSSSIKVDLDPSADMLRGIGGWVRSVPAGTIRHIEPKRGGAGFDAWDSLFYDRIVPLKGDNPMLVRLDMTMRKIMMLLAVNERKASIDSEVVERAALLLPYLTQGYALAERSISLSKEDRVAEALERALRKFGPISEGRLRQRMKDNGYDWSTVDRVMRGLERTSILRMEYQNPKGGPKTTKLTWAD